MSFWGTSLRVGQSDPNDLEGFSLHCRRAVLENPHALAEDQYVQVRVKCVCEADEDDCDEAVVLCLLSRKEPQVSLDLLFTESTEFYIESDAKDVRVSLSGFVDVEDDSDDGDMMGSDDEETDVPDLIGNEDDSESGEELSDFESAGDESAEASSADETEAAGICIEEVSDSEGKQLAIENKPEAPVASDKAAVAVRKSESKAERSAAVEAKLKGAESPASEAAESKPLSKTQRKKLAKEQRLQAEKEKVEKREADTKEFLDKSVGLKKQLPSGVAFEVLKVGNGRAATKGKRLTVKYECRVARTGKKADAGQLAFRIGAGEMIAGFDMGCDGMLLGEKRRLFVPSRHAYGKNGAPPQIPPNSDLIFEVEAKNIA